MPQEPPYLHYNSKSIQRTSFGLEGAELEEVSELPLEEVEVSEQPLEGVLGEVSGWKECAVELGTAGRSLE